MPEEIYQPKRKPAEMYEGTPCKRCSGTLFYMRGNRCFACIKAYSLKHKEAKKAYCKQHRQKPHIQEQEKQRRESSEMKNYHREYVKVYNQRPEVKERLQLGNRKRHLMKKFGLTWEAYQTMFENQHGCCLICGDALVQPHTDHDHETGKVRGLLCQECNHLLGNAKDDPAILRSAITYLERAG